MTWKDVMSASAIDSLAVRRRKHNVCPAAVDFASATSKCIKSPLNTGVLLCKELQEDTKTCQAKGRTVLISMGGGNSPSPNWVDAADAEKSAQLIWDMFGPVTSSKVDRPFGTSVVNGFDLDFDTGQPSFCFC
ncbi:chitinase-like protein [Beauveria bassiana ARSEF 2860]|uniref:Chitinase-like protein n=1 Tax=Beauveria bassiana (strain ARSEF 2860) TaxID=655819 RepID=J4UGC9_BEAB2|nr:chitinase-like protein [Beauveria bassiana ARSEF 2860]EJP61872.1 chitinase-like protein [Beauveria bassiana ARSEF 2860]